MKKTFFALFCFFLPSIVLAKSAYLKSMEPFNGYLLTPFNPQNNVYTIVLDEGATKLDFQYTLEEENAQVEVTGDEYIENQENKMVIKITEEETLETQEYIFYLERAETQNVLNEQSNNISLELNKKNPIPHLKLIVVTICTILIGILFKFLIINYFKRKKKKSLA